MKDTTSLGNLTEGVVLAALLKIGKKVLTPFGGGLPYDLVVDNGTELIKIQCKTGRLVRENSVVEFRVYTTLRGGKSKIYSDVGAYGVYCPQNGKVYLIPAKDCNKSTVHLRVLPTKNGIKSRVRLASTYEI